MPWTKVLVDKTEFERTLGKDGLRGRSYKQALLEAQDQLLAAHDNVYLIGEGIDDPGGVFGSVSGLVEKYGRDRVMDMPISENGMTGITLGSAICGMRPILIHMRMDFLPMGMDMLTNHAAKWSYMTGGRLGAPLVVRSIIGKGWGSAAQHSQALHGLFLSTAGLKIAVPATPYDAKGLLMAASRDGNPVLFCEHRWLYDFNGYVPEEAYTVEFGKAVVRRPGRDITIVAVSLMVYEAVKAAQELEKLGIDAEILDPRTIKPLDLETILASVAKTGRLLIADCGPATGGFASEVAARVAEKGFSHLKNRIGMVGLPDCPTPASPALEKAFYPDCADIVKLARELTGK